MAEQFTQPAGSIAPDNGQAAGAWVAGRPRAAEAVKSARNWLYVTAAVSMIAGVLAILVPAVASVTVAILVGWLLLFFGVFALAHAWSVRAPGRGLRIFNSLLTALAGLALIVFPLTGTFTLTFFLAVWFLVTGTVYVAAAIQHRGEAGAGLMGLHGVVSLLLGILIIADLPSSADWAIGLLVGVNLVFFSVRALIAANVLNATLKAR
jgi:uncharacterized membrane protein HdeD (DUF308 family)